MTECDICHKMVKKADLLTIKDNSVDCWYEICPVCSSNLNHYILQLSLQNKIKAGENHEKINSAN